MEKYNKRVSTYKHGEVQQKSVNLQTWRSTTTSVNLQTWISTTNECQPTNIGELQQKSVNLQTSRSTPNECQPTNMEKYNKRVSTYKHGEV